MHRNLAVIRNISLLALVIFALAPRLAAHDIPNDATIQMFFKPDGNHLSILVRVPLKTMRDVEFPIRGEGYLDFDRVDTTLREASVLWVSDFIDVYENDTRLPKPQVAKTRLSVESDPSFASYETALAHLDAPKLSNGSPNLLGSVDARCSLRLPDPIGPVSLFNSSGSRPAGVARGYRAAFPAARRSRPRF